MSKIGNLILELEERGDMFFCEERRTYEFRNRTERRHEGETQWRTTANNTLGQHVFEGCGRHYRRGRRTVAAIIRRAKRLQKVARPSNKSRSERVSHRQARQGWGHRGASLLQERPVKR